MDSVISENKITTVVVAGHPARLLGPAKSQGGGLW